MLNERQKAVVDKGVDLCHLALFAPDPEVIETVRAGVAGNFIKTRGETAPYRVALALATVQHSRHVNAIAEAFKTLGLAGSANGASTAPGASGSPSAESADDGSATSTPRKRKQTA